MSPVFIPSNRPSPALATTLPFLQEAGYEFVIFTEPRLATLYESRFSGSVYDIGKDSQGIAYVRQFILDFARAAGVERFWCIDDDVTEFGQNTGTGKVEPADAWIMGEAEALFPETAAGACFNHVYNMGLGVRAGKAKELTWTTRCNIFALWRTAGIPCEVRYRAETAPLEDIDFNLQLIRAGAIVGRFNNFAIRVPGQNKPTDGGNAEAWKEENRIAANERMIAYWGKECLVVPARWRSEDGKKRFNVEPRWIALQAFARKNSFPVPGVSS